MFIPAGTLFPAGAPAVRFSRATGKSLHVREGVATAGWPPPRRPPEPSAEILDRNPGLMTPKKTPPLLPGSSTPLVRRPIAEREKAVGNADYSEKYPSVQKFFAMDAAPAKNSPKGLLAGEVKSLWF